MWWCMRHRAHGVVRWCMARGSAHVAVCRRRRISRGGAPRARAPLAPPFSGEHSTRSRNGTAAVAGRCPMARSHREMRQSAMRVEAPAGGKGSCLRSVAKRSASCRTNGARSEGGQTSGAGCGRWVQAGCRQQHARFRLRG
eukprot:1330803-Prymnesium_polylepis.1